MIRAEQKDFDYTSIPAGYYDEVFRREKGVQSAWHHLKFNHVRSAFLPDYRDHLDIGCGAGTFIATLPENRQSTGVDIAAAQIAFAQENYGSDRRRFVCVDAMKQLPFDEGTFDVVTMVEVIEHISMADNRRMLAEALRVLRPGGRIILTTPNYASLWPVLEALVNRLGEVTYEDQHISPFNRASLAKLLEETGFGRVSVSTFQGLAPFLAALGWRIAHRLQHVENRVLRPGMGFLLLGLGEKPPALSAAASA